MTTRTHAELDALEQPAPAVPLRVLFRRIDEEVR